MPYPALNPQSYRVIEALEEGGLQLRHKGLEAWPCLLYEQPQGDQDGGLDGAGETITNDTDERTSDGHGEWFEALLSGEGHQLT